MNVREGEHTGRLAWPLAGLSGVLAGILLGLGLWWGLFVLTAGLGWAWLDRRLWLSLLALICTLLGWASLRWQEAQPDRLSPWIGAQVRLEGSWDGQFLTLKDPPARVVLAPKPQQDPGWLVVGGRLVRPQGRRTPGGFDQAAWLRAQGGLFLPTPTTVLVRAQVIQYRPEGGLRGWFRRGLSAGLGQRPAALMQAIELGERNDIGREHFDEEYSVRDAFNRSGLAHLMALSGQNVALITGAVLLILLGLNVPLSWRYGAAILLLLIYFFLLISASASITRAVIMGIAGLLGLALGRGRPDPIGIIALAALLCLLFFPLWVLDIGFQLSFLAVLALTQTPFLARRLPERWPQPLRLGLAATLLAEWGTWPVIAHNFGQLPTVGLLANLLAEPIMALLVPLGFLAGLLGPAAVLVNWLNSLLASALLWVVETLGRAPVIAWGQLSAGGFLAYGLGFLALIWWLRGKLRGSVFVTVVLGLLLLSWLPNKLRPAREIVFLDVGQGDSTLIRLPQFTMLIDAGGSVGSDYDVGGKTVVPALRALGIRALNVAVVTHADTDHAEGVLSVLKALPVGELWIGQRKEEDPLLAQILRLAQQRGVPIRQVRRGDQLALGGYQLKVLWPEGKFWSTEDNENSVAMVLEKTGAPQTFRAAFLGDLPAPAEHLIGVGDLTLLKAAHHGSRFSTSAALLRQTTPQDVLISVGASNTYGHPTPAVLERVAQAKAKVWRTDELGTVRWPLP